MRGDARRWRGAMGRVALCATACALLAGCAQGSVEQNSQTPAVDMGEPPDAVDMDMSTAPDDPDMPGEVDMAPAPRRVQTVVSPTAGGGRVQTPKHRARIIVGPPTPAGRAKAGKYGIKLGAGAAQHGQ